MPMWLTYEHFLLLLLVLLANGSPLIARGLLGSALARPLDGGRRFIDGQPLFGSTKTLRGIASALLLTPLASLLLGLGWQLGLLIGLFAMLGDLTSSFIKRRLGMPSSSMALGLDQVPESLFPLLACRFLVDLPALQISLLVALFFISELGLSRLLYRLRLRKHPY